MGPKAEVKDIFGRFREIISDPLNLLIRRDPRAGFVEENYVYLHNGLKVAISGPYAYYGNFSSILPINRGVHEPLEEFVFQEVINRLPSSPRMIELGAYWGHYSMWLKAVRRNATVHLIEPKQAFLDTGKHNFEVNGLSGEFTLAHVGKGQLGVDQFMAEKRIEHLDVLHSDIQGDELEMLDDCSHSLTNKTIDRLLVSTHSQPTHHIVIKVLSDYGYRIEVASDFEFGTTSHDGFVLATSPSVDPIFVDFHPVGRVQLEETEPAQALQYLSNIVQHQLAEIQSPRASA